MGVDVADVEVGDDVAVDCDVLADLVPKVEKSHLEPKTSGTVKNNQEKD